MNAPATIMEQLKALPEHLQPHNRRFYVEALSDGARAPLVEYFRREAEADGAAFEWSKAHGAEGFYPARDGGHPRAFSFKIENAPAPGGAWNDAGRGFVPRSGYVAKALSKRPAGKTLAAELNTLPEQPRYSEALDHLGAITDLGAGNGFRGVGSSDGKYHFAVPIKLGDRYFISGVNHNYDIAQHVESAIQYVGTENEKWAPSLDYDGDPISWRPGEGWVFLTKTELDFAIAEANLRRAKKRTPEASA
ncbi:hypothetical protein [Brevundimonas sp.]|uniref:hypothetical protein n=1 Tax=Brevundimonas sp. TaxID=1871086 RepID=UPI0025B958F9|nr:hypothetical protein [Brevundimonas sp.]